MDVQTTSIINSIVTNIITISAVFISGYVSYRYSNKIKNIENKNDILRKFFNPICSLLKENNSIYMEFGPLTFSKDDFNRRNESAEIWESIKEKVILHNLTQIRNIILENGHIIEEFNLQNTCNELKMHCIIFIEYNNNPFEFYKKHKYKQDWFEIIDKERIKIINRRNK